MDLSKKSPAQSPAGLTPARAVAVRGLEPVHCEMCGSLGGSLTCLRSGCESAVVLSGDVSARWPRAGRG